MIYQSNIFQQYFCCIFEEKEKVMNKHFQRIVVSALVNCNLSLISGIYNGNVELRRKNKNKKSPFNKLCTKMGVESGQLSLR